MSKLRRNIIIVMMLLGVLTGCASASNTANEDTSSNKDTKGKVNNSGEIECVFATESKLEGYAVVRPTCTLLLKTDGNIIGRGDSSYGEMGNGERTESANWTFVEGLENVKKIYADKHFGTGEELDSAFCYALTEDGDIYRWGGNVLKPEIVIRDIKDMYHCDGDSPYFAIEYNDGKKAILADGKVRDITSIVENSKLLYTYNVEEFMIVRDVGGMVSYIDVDIVDDEIVERQRYEVGRDIQSIGCKATEWYTLSNGNRDKGTVIYVISKAGAVNRFVVENNELGFLDDWDGSGYEAFYRLGYDEDRNIFSMFGSTIWTSGANEYGQLGDGTTLDYYDGWITVDEVEGIELHAAGSKWGPYCVALDKDNNIWCWGGYFGTTPKIEITDKLETEEEY